VRFVRCRGVSERVPFDSADYDRRTREGPCFICAIAAGEPEYRGVTTMIHESSDVLVFLNRYPTLRGYTLVCPRQHVEHVVGETTESEGSFQSRQRKCWSWRVKSACVLSDTQRRAGDALNAGAPQTTNPVGAPPR